MGVHIVDFGDVTGKKRNAATQTQDLEDPTSFTCKCISPDGQKKGPDQLNELKSPSSEYKVYRAGNSEENAIPLDAADLISESQK